MSDILAQTKIIFIGKDSSSTHWRSASLLLQLPPRNAIHPLSMTTTTYPDFGPRLDDMVQSRLAKSLAITTSETLLVECCAECNLLDFFVACFDKDDDSLKMTHCSHNNDNSVCEAFGVWIEEEQIILYSSRRIVAVGGRQRSDLQDCVLLLSPCLPGSRCFSTQLHFESTYFEVQA